MRDVVIELDLSETYQTIHGFGGALTDAANVNLLDMEKDVRESVIEAYYGVTGIGYSIGRLTIGGCDFSTHTYTYADDVVDDFKLEHFSVHEDVDSGKIGRIGSFCLISPFNFSEFW